MDVIIANPDTGVVVTVTDGAVIGQSNSFDVVEYLPFAGLVGYWTFDEISGTNAADSSGQSNDGTLVNTPTWTTGMADGALSFNGTNQSVSIADANSLDFGTADFSFAAWIRMGTTRSGCWGPNFCTSLSRLRPSSNSIT